MELCTQCCHLMIHFIMHIIIIIIIIMDFPDPLSPAVSIVYRARQVFLYLGSAVVDRFKLVAQPLLVRVMGSLISSSLFLQQ